ncbi:hypothetical protein HY933_04335 [Candidatus Falkowbacteria bacterium]|nr:hypothetical protein [Candidatus Falkowbacteria bacterium]
MKKFIYTLVVMGLLLSAVPITALAQGEPSIGDTLFEVATQGGYSEVKEDTLVFTVAKGLRFFFSVLGIIFLIIIVYAGFRWMTAGGNEEQISEAKKWLTNSIIGLIIIILAYSITYFVGAAVSYSTVSDHPFYD